MIVDIDLNPRRCRAELGLVRALEELIKWASSCLRREAEIRRPQSFVKIEDR
jgi:hypothetical protein